MVWLINTTTCQFCTFLQESLQSRMNRVKGQSLMVSLYLLEGLDVLLVELPKTTTLAARNYRFYKNGNSQIFSRMFVLAKSFEELFTPT